jgi:hypothetical protein
MFPQHSFAASQTLTYVARPGQNTANKVYFLIGLSTDQKANSFGLASFSLAAKLHRQSGSDRLEKQPIDLRRHHHYMRDGVLHLD